MLEIAPSILSADFTRLAEEIKRVEEAGAQVLHFDVMDGRFVPNITIGLPVLRSVRKVTKMTIDTHLMIVEPSRYAVEFAEAGADMVSVHIEADPHIHRTLAAIRQAGSQAGIAINPGTSVTALDEAINYADFILVMSVNPGFGGQAFIPEALQRVRRLKATIRDRGLATRIEIDGGIDTGNIAEVVEAGVDIAVAGSAIFGSDDPAATVKEMLEKGTVWV